MSINSIIQYVPDDAEIIDIANKAKSDHLYLITNGIRSALSPIVPDGWKVQMRPEARLDQLLEKAS